MPRLIEVPDVRDCPSQLMLYTGDVLLFRATGGHVQSGAGVVELLGPFLTAVPGDTGDILSPQGPPNSVMFRARKPGRARIDIASGTPFSRPQMTIVDIFVEP